MTDADFEARLAALPRARGHLLPALRLAQASFGYVPDAALARVADHLRLTVNDVEGVVTSYPDLARVPRGASLVRACTGPACWAAGAPQILSTLEATLGIAPGDTTPDGRVTLQETACAFACAVAPVVEVDGRLMGRLTPTDAAGVARRHAAPEVRESSAADPAQRFGHHRLPSTAAGSDLQALLARALERHERERPAARLLVGAGSCALAVGATAVVRALKIVVASRRARVAVVEAGCTGMCHAQVQVMLERPGQAGLTWSRVEPEHAGALVEAALGRRPDPALPPAFAWGQERAAPFLVGQRRLLSADFGRVDPVDLDEALMRGVYRGLARAVSLPAEAVVEEVGRARLSGRGGAYFPVARKWEACRAAGGRRRYLVVNAEEGEPGVFKDRHLLEGDPHRVIEGLLIAAYAIGAEHSVVYVNGEAALARARLLGALGEAERGGLVGPSVFGRLSCTVEVRDGGGGYVLGEESALLESLEGRRSMPRIRPPYPVEAGLGGAPTVVNNAETLATVPFILDRGAEWFTRLGASDSPGTKLVCVTGDIAHPGLIEVETGTTLGHVLDTLAGGGTDGRRLQAVLTGGPSGILVPPDSLGAPLTPRHPDVLLGSGNLLALDDRRPLLDLVRLLTRFNAEESCGKCTPCREGVSRMREILDRVAAGDRRSGDRDDLLELSTLAAGASICGLGQMAPNPVLSALHRFALLGQA